jgi:glucokinase
MSVRVNAMTSAIGIDIGGSNLRAARIDSGGRFSERLFEAISRNPEFVVRRIVELCRTLDDRSVTAIGIGVPGRVDARRREVLSGGYIDLAETHLAERIEDALGKPVVIDNDCNMALVAEMSVGAAQGCRNAVMFTIGTGIGGGVALDGHIARGAGTAGQLGHITVASDGVICNCGRRGCVETTSSGSALGRHIAEAGVPAHTRVEDLLRAADSGDAPAADVLMRWVGPLRSAIDSMVAAVAPDIVLLGGGLGKAARQALDRAPALSPWYQCPVEAARLGDDAGVIGAGLTASRAIGGAGLQSTAAMAGV